MRPRQEHVDWGRHIYRELNGEADAIAGRHHYSYSRFTQRPDFRCFRLYFDGSCAQHGSGGGWVLYGAVAIVEDSLDAWTKIAELSFPLGEKSTVTIAELEACLWGVTYVSAVLRCEAALSHHLETWRPLDTSQFELLELSGLVS